MSFETFFLSSADLERKNSDTKAKLDEVLVHNRMIDNEQDKVGCVTPVPEKMRNKETNSQGLHFQIRLLDKRNEDDHNRMHAILNELMEEAAQKTKKEIESLKAIYNRNIEKMIDDCSMLESVRN